MATDYMDFYGSEGTGMVAAYSQVAELALPAAGGAVAGAGICYGIGLLGQKMTDKYPVYGAGSRVILDSALGVAGAAAATMAFDDPEKQVAVASGVIAGAIAPALTAWVIAKRDAMIEDAGAEPASEAPGVDEPASATV